MFVYWAMFIAPAFTALIARDFSRDARRFRVGFWLLLVAIALVMGLRWEVGADWWTYDNMVMLSRYESLTQTWSYGDPAFGTLVWLSGRLGLGQLGPNLVSGGLLTWGLYRFAIRQADPWIVIASAVPYLIIVVGMGYVRQGAAIGLVLIALASWFDGRFAKAIAAIGFASLFHVSAIVILPILGMVVARRSLPAVIGIGIVGTAVMAFLLVKRWDFLVEAYSTQGMDSSGAAVRLAMNAVPAVLFLLLRRRFPFNAFERQFWLLCSLLAVALAVAVFLTEATTMLDRLGLYLIPLQLVVFGNFSQVLTERVEGKSLLRAALLAYAGGVLFIWLFYATHAEYWLPYRTLFNP